MGKKEPKLGVDQIITLCKINNGMFTNLDLKIIEELENANLVERVGSGSNKYVLATQYQSLYEQTLKIGTRYLIEEIRILVLELQDKKMKIGEMEVNLSKYLNRNQIKYLLSKILQDEVLVKDGKGKGTNYFIATKFDQYRGEILINQIITFLKDKYS